MRAALCLFCLCVCGLPAGCGTRGEPRGSSLVATPPRVSKAQLTKQLEGDCLDLNGVLQTIARSSPNPADTFYDAYSEGVTRMRAGVPPRYLGGLRDFLTAGRNLASAYGRAGEAAEGDSRSILKRLMKDAAVAKARFSRLAADRGIRYCGKGPDPRGAATSGAEDPDTRP
jgi:hypothetical protein